MPKAEWGTKHSCTACTAKFYDLNRSPPYCPQCGMIITMEGGIPPPAVQEDEAVDNDADVTIETDDDVEGEEDPEIED